MQTHISKVLLFIVFMCASLIKLYSVLFSVIEILFYLAFLLNTLIIIYLYIFLL